MIFMPAIKHKLIHSLAYFKSLLIHLGWLIMRKTCFIHEYLFI